MDITLDNKQWTSSEPSEPNKIQPKSKVCHYTCMSEYVTVCQSMSLYVRVCHYMSEYVTVCHYMSEYVTVCQSMSLYVRVCAEKPTANHIEIIFLNV